MQVSVGDGKQSNSRVCCRAADFAVGVKQLPVDQVLSSFLGSDLPASRRHGHAGLPASLLRMSTAVWQLSGTKARASPETLGRQTFTMPLTSLRAQFIRSRIAQDQTGDS